MLTVFFYARMWRRSRVLTDLEFYELRYAGKAATFVRGFRAIYLGLFFNCVIMATVNLAAAKIANIVLGWPMWQTLLLCSTITIFFASVSGLWGVLVTDSIQITITIQWWSVWYPGAEPGGGSYIAQRMLASRTERDALSGTLFFNAMHYALRPWPWIIVALSSLVIYPQLADIHRAFPYVNPKLIGNDMAYPAMLRFLPAGFLGLMIAGMLASYRSTIETHLNWGTSYLVHDFYRRFLNRGASERHYVFVGRVTTALLMVCAALLTFALNTAKESFQLILSVGAGTGLIYLLRWYWWRINAWSEVAAMVSSFVVAVAFFVAGKAGHR